MRSAIPFALLALAACSKQGAVETGLVGAGVAAPAPQAKRGRRFRRPLKRRIGFGAMGPRGWTIPRSPPSRPASGAKRGVGTRPCLPP